MAVELVTVVNMVLAMIICTVGLWNYTKSRSTMSFYTGVGFGIFALSHIIVLAGMETTLALPLMVVRIAGYMLVLFGLLYCKPEELGCKTLNKKKKAK